MRVRGPQSGPCRAGPFPSHWAWSSFRHYAYGEPNDLIVDAPEYLSLGHTGPARRKAYLHLFAARLIESLRSRRPPTSSTVPSSATATG